MSEAKEYLSLLCRGSVKRSKGKCERLTIGREKGEQYGMRRRGEREQKERICLEVTREEERKVRGRLKDGGRRPRLRQGKRERRDKEKRK